VIEGALWIFVFCAVMSLRRGVCLRGFVAGRGSEGRKRTQAILFLLSLEKVDAQRVDGGVSARLRGREGVVEREGKNAGPFYFYFLRRK